MPGVCLLKQYRLTSEIKLLTYQLIASEFDESPNFQAERADFRPVTK